MAKAIATYEGRIHGFVHGAIRGDGALFKRYQNKTRSGYKWSAWKFVEMLDPKDIPAEIPSEFSTLVPANYYTSFKARLPN
jgi:hypothetical protein